MGSAKEREFQKHVQGLTDKRERLMKSISDHLKYWENNAIKYYFYNLSNGCQNCFAGFAADLTLTMLCNRRCFFCPQVRDPSFRPRIGPEDILLDNAQNAVDFIRKTKINQISFSGGEPLVVYKDLLEYMKKIKEELRNVYMVLYTNGDLLTEDKARELNQYGLNEIRFNLSARGFDLGPVAIAVKHIKRVLVATPAVPEELGKMKAILPRLAELGVTGLNYYELIVNRDNYEAFKKRKYTIRNGAFGVMESEITVLELMNYALEKKIKFPIHFCNRDYKLQDGSKIINLRYRSFLLEKYESFSKGGKYKRIVVKNPSAALKKWLRDNAKPFLEQYGSLHLHPSLLPDVRRLDNPGTITVQYLDVYVYNKEKKSITKKILINKNYSIYGRKKITHKIVVNKKQMELYERLFVNNEPVQKLVKESLPSKKKLSEVIRFFKRFANLEYFGWPLDM